MVVELFGVRFRVDRVTCLAEVERGAPFLNLLTRAVDESASKVGIVYRRGLLSAMGSPQWKEDTRLDYAAVAAAWEWNDAVIEESRRFVLEHFGHAERLVLGVTDLAPKYAAALAQPSVEFLKAVPFSGLRVDPDAPAAVLDVLLDHAFLPAARNVAKVSVEQIVRAHHGKAGVDDAALAAFATFTAGDLVHRRLHVVVNAPPSHAAQSGE